MCWGQVRASMLVCGEDILLLLLLLLSVKTGYSLAVHRDLSALLLSQRSAGARALI